MTYPRRELTAEGARKRARALEKRARRATARETLDHVGHALHGGAGLGGAFVGREREFASLRALLESPARASLMLLGERGAGKSALVREWARETRSLIWATSGAQLVAGQSGPRPVAGARSARARVPPKSSTPSSISTT